MILIHRPVMGQVSARVIEGLGGPMLIISTDPKREVVYNDVVHIQGDRHLLVAMMEAALKALKEPITAEEFAAVLERTRRVSP